VSIPLAFRSIALVVLASFAAGACASKPGVQSQRLPDGTIRLVCEGSLTRCLDSAETFCKGAPYDVLRARDQRDRFGAELGTSQVEVRASEAVIRCAGAHASEPQEPQEPQQQPANPAGLPPGMSLPPPQGPVPPLPLPPPEPAPAHAPARVCIPGTTQACVGPGACEGGQSCLPSGTAFGPCDCGTLGPPATAASSAPPSGSGAPPPPAAPKPTPKPTPKPKPTARPAKTPAPPPPVAPAPGPPLAPAPVAPAPVAPPPAVRP
jgi:hypothetical protein